MLAMTLIPLLLTGALLSAFGVFGGDDDDDAKTAQSITPSEGDDVLVGTDGDDEINGKGGDDILLGAAGNDTLYGREGDDWVLGEAGDDSLRGGDGDDILVDLVGADTLNAGAGNDWVVASGMPSNLLETDEDWDFSEGDYDGDEIYLGRGNDGAEVGFDDTVTGGEGADTFSVLGALQDHAGHDAPEITDFAPGNDRLMIHYTNEIAPRVSFEPVEGGGVNVIVDTHIAAHLSNLNSVDEISEQDIMLVRSYGSEPQLLYKLKGTDGDDILSDGPESSEIVALAGDDLIDAGVGQDTVFGQDGDDTVYGGEGDDSLRGGAGEDLIVDIQGADIIKSGADNDVVIASGMASNIDLVSDRTNPAILSTDGWSYAEGDIEGDEVYLGDGDDLAIIGYNDTVTGGTGVDTFTVLGADGELGDNAAPIITDFSILQDMLVIYYTDGTEPVITYALSTAGTVEVLADGQVAAQLTNLTSLEQVNTINTILFSA
ncbi:calcium-binding protein [Litorivita sp. NS0012-18]|uniref:calcium-binding protein n=1 Tax=Litorivita sp. NS0012-18 TaxID=3127655 RepID=UPI0031066D4B